MNAVRHHRSYVGSRPAMASAHLPTPGSDLEITAPHCGCAP